MNNMLASDFLSDGKIVDLTEDKDPEGNDYGGALIPDEKFRFNRSSVFLTYAQCDGKLNKELVLTFFKTLNAHRFIISEENHIDGGLHIHAAIWFPKKLDIRNCRCFDINHVHPNIRKIHDPTGAIEYVAKDGDYIMSHGLSIKMFPNSKGFVKKHNDHLAWMRYMQRYSKDEVKWPIELPDGTRLLQPEAKDKKRHWFIVGPPDCGKTFWSLETFKGQRVYRVPTNHNYPFEDYEDQEVIIFDDYPLSEKFTDNYIITLANVWNCEMHVPGPVRYVSKFLKENQVRTIFILANPLHMPSWFNEDRIQARFERYDMVAWNERPLLEIDMEPIHPASPSALQFHYPLRWNNNEEPIYPDSEAETEVIDLTQ
nr:MAG: replication associated protein [Cressdnaviricota sp.]